MIEIGEEEEPEPTCASSCVRDMIYGTLYDCLILIKPDEDVYHLWETADQHERWKMGRCFICHKHKPILSLVLLSEEIHVHK